MKSAFSVLTYRFVGWWLTTLMLIMFWVIPLVFAVCLIVISLGFAFVIKEFQKWWGGPDAGVNPWKW